MKKILIISGGTGSIALQNGFMKKYCQDTFELNIIINAYDNGKSTGACRKVFNDLILGPSDLRKNHLTQFKNIYSSEIKNNNSWHSKILSIFELRLSAETAINFYREVLSVLKQYNYILGEKDYFFLKSLIDYFFFDNNEIRSSLKSIDFTDFSISNIFYASLASLNDNKLSKAGTIMASFLKIKDNVHLISDINLYLKAITEKGNKIEDEEDIVAWSNENDKICKILLEDKFGVSKIPKVDEGMGSSICYRLIKEADIIIFSSGTQWSSLIPTYIHKGFYTMIENSSAKKYLVMNNSQDYDMFGVNSEQLCSILKDYIPIEQITVVLNNNADSEMKRLPKNILSISGKISDSCSKKHNGIQLINLIMKDYFQIKKEKVIFSDLDGTLWNEYGTFLEKEIGRKNLEIFKGYIFSGNSKEHILNIIKNVSNCDFMGVFGDYGNSNISKLNLNEIEYISEKFNLNTDIYNDLLKFKKYGNKVKIRGNVIITIKPLTERKKEREWLINYLKSKYGDEFEVNIAGNTSIDISKKGFNKGEILKLLLKSKRIRKEDVIYLGNELEVGNEVEVKHLNIHTIQVEDVFDCNMFLETYYSQL